MRINTHTVITTVSTRKTYNPLKYELWSENPNLHNNLSIYESFQLTAFTEEMSLKP